MNLRRFSLILMVVSIALMGVAWYLHSDGREAQAADAAPASAPAPTTSIAPAAAPARPAEPAGPEAATKPATRPAAATAPATQPAATTAPASQPAAPEGMWFDNTASTGPRYTIGSLAPSTKEGKDNYLVQVELVGKGAAINTLKLADFYATVQDKLLAGRMDNHQAYLDKVAQDKGYHGHYSLLNPVSYGSRTYLPLATEKFTVTMGSQSGMLESDRYWQLAGPAKEDANSQSITFQCTMYFGKDQQQAGKFPVLRVLKTYTVRKGSYSVEVSLKFENLTDDKSLTLTVDQLGPTGVGREDVQTDERMGIYGRLKGAESTVLVTSKASTELKDWPLGQPVVLGHSDGNDPMLWVGSVNRFFGSMLYAVPVEEGRLQAPDYHGEFYVAAGQESASSKTFLTGVKFDRLNVRAGQAKEIRFDLFAGPKKRDIFVDAKYPQHRPLYNQLNYISTLSFGSCFCASQWLTLAMMWLLEMFSKVAFGNYGVGIILLVLLVRLVLHPLTKRSQVSMSRMQKMGPEVARIKEKYADDKESLNREMMQFYKKQGFSPVMGCLPMVLQMPIWIALWGGLQASVELRHAAFLPIWITDLSAPDALFTWGATLPVIGNTLNLLPLLLTVAMFFQAKMQPTAAAATSDQARQQQMMKWMMPGMMLFIFYNTPSGLTLYIMASTAAGVFEQIVIKKHIAERDAVEAETTVKVSGGGMRSSRGKKPKGPFWSKR